MSKLQCVSLRKNYESGVTAVHEFNLTIEEGEFIVFVGPSGCGKSTTLRMIAGLEDITEGDLVLNGERVNDIAAKERDMAMVFQSYALYPHMTVYDNLAFHMKMKRVPKREQQERIAKVAELLQLGDYLKRKPSALSGGQRQRVALGRAIIRKPQLFLMDEPLSNLDAKLRATMRAELLSLHREIGATTIYVTHDQTEAMTMADRIVVMNGGRIQQIGTPSDVYHRPANQFVAQFVGSPMMNIMPHTKDANVGVRPEHLTLHREHGRYEATVQFIERLGATMIVHLMSNGLSLQAVVNSEQQWSEGEVVYVDYDERYAHYFAAQTGERLEK